MTVEEYATALALASAQIVAATRRRESTRPHIRAALSLQAPAGTDRYGALINVLAAQADPDTSLSQRLAWCNNLRRAS